ncbi:ATP-dependent RNA helicase DBP7 [Arthroderma uncinatum]|uniref:ATP-dependent RNA helicase DBP7 n=1 Tax=Arthroderma uncinatum TaxID=74035 RepID=UPI00144AF1B4|nr:ATP-dependent RNA helicase DBP7 [Arthroderma uncinatum]KAF3483090.1 ATP-dependent RNA helicase DBP7 [Arthroderma uncinatum]
MADDGMLMNFDVGDGIISSQQKFRGGKWKDRLVAKKIADHRHKKSQQPNTAGDNSQAARREDRDHGGAPNRPPKRQRLNNGDFQPSSATITGTPNNASSRYANGPQREVISSLFSYNPVATTASPTDATAAQDDSEAPKASNAPLVDGIDTFTSLGLSPELAAHLLTKLNLKNPTAIQKSSITQLLKENCDGFIQAETGSGKTLAYLLPLVQRLMDLSGPKSAEGGQGSSTPIHRDSGLFAIILAPTRELCKQISVVLDGLLNCAHWLVAGTVIGGEKKKSEKARLRKGLNILVATPGRLADHLDNTQVLDVGLVRWLVLDEGDRLMELGFEEEIQGIIKKLDSKRRPTSKIANLPSRRLTILCSATLKMNVQRLGEMSLKDAVHIQADPADEAEENASETGGAQKDSEFSAPAQLKQSFAIVASKLRLVALTALLKSTFARKGTVMKAIVFVSCADSVDYHFEVFSRKPNKPAIDEGGDKEKKEKREKKEKKEKRERKGKEDKEENDEKEEEGSDSEEAPAPNASLQGTVAQCPTLSNPTNSVVLHKLHGSLPQHVRTATLAAFAKQKDTSVLICTDVASRGLDLPNVDFVIEYDPAFSADDHLHRIGRTARLGRDGRALIFLLPGSEEGYIKVLKRGYRDDNDKAVTRSDANDILKRGFGRNNNAAGKGWEEAATEFQLDIERWTLDNPTILEMARRAFQSHIRAYATHIASEREFFNIKDLHLGHLAKGFGLRDRPTKINVPGLRTGKEETTKAFKANRAIGAGDKKNDSGPSNDSAAQRMRKKMREHMTAANEFNIA